ncbi:hypothetical protein BBI11_08935 [Planococcus maritimus]|nr:hypothetical protein BBI11_08935 [Planococcus maritimus]
MDHKHFIIVRCVTTILILLSMILPYFGIIKHSSTPTIILITFFVFHLLETKYEHNLDRGLKK